MKCVKLIHTGEVKRVSNEQADRCVKTGTHTFCPKSEWKALRVTPVVAIVHTDEQKREIQRKADKRKHSADKRSYRKS
jgi:hypothetical protein